MSTISSQTELNKHNDTLESSRIPQAGYPSKVAHALRVAGAFAISISAATFLLQGPFGAWPSGRLLGFLTFVGLLGVCGFVAGLVLNETKGARTFLALGAALASVAWAQLGGLAYATYSNVVDWMPPILRFDGVSTIELAGLILLSSVITSALWFATFSVLLRRLRLDATLVTLTVSFLLLIPIRDPGLVALVSGGLLLLVRRWINSQREEVKREFAFEEKIACGLVVVPILLMMGRSLCYGHGQPIIVVASLALAIAASSFLPEAAERAALRNFYRLTSLLSGTVAWVTLQSMLFFAQGEAWYFSPFGELPERYVALVVVYPLCGFLYWIATLKDKPSGALRVIALALAGVTSLSQLSHYEGAIVTVMAILVGMGCLIDAHARSERWSQLLGGYILFVGLFRHIKEAVHLLTMSPWISLGLAGVVVLFLSSHYERRKRETSRI